MYAFPKEFEVHSSEAGVVPKGDCEVFFPDFELAQSNICMVLDHILPYSVVRFKFHGDQGFQ